LDQGRDDEFGKFDGCHRRKRSLLRQKIEIHQAFAGRTRAYQQNQSEQNVTQDHS